MEENAKEASLEKEVLLGRVAKTVKRIPCVVLCSHLHLRRRKSAESPRAGQAN